jgi:hypothetical protein
MPIHELIRGSLDYAMLCHWPSCKTTAIVDINEKELWSDEMLNFSKITGLTGLLLFLLTACTPTVQLEAPEKPITINLNVKIEHEIKVKVDKDLESVFSKDSGLF